TSADPQREEAPDGRVLLIHGDADSIRPTSRSELLRADLVAAGVNVEMVVIAGGTHASVVCANFEPILQLSNPATQLSPPMREAVESIAQFVLN
ncbi:MAG TPA: hypothetical protein VES40_16635, partial [Ilumatobacteraceae bacterium]|nr:hypothetical protein [Ilumatobacteraceae bacterium]